jgi:hypothetical protein
LILTKRKRKIKSRSEELKEDFTSSATYKHTSARRERVGRGRSSKEAKEAITRTSQFFAFQMEILLLDLMLESGYE